jgi:hypothetical protein
VFGLCSQEVYWSDVTERSIHVAGLDGSRHRLFLSASNHSLGVVDGLALDASREELGACFTKV